MNKIYDVIVIGAGPAGCQVAAKLADNGFNTLLLEKCSLPRYKICGGGVTKRALDKMPINIDSIVKDEITTLEVSLDGKQNKVFQHHEPVVFSVMRNDLDFLLANYAKKCGATLLSNVTVKHVEEIENHVKVDTDDQTYYGKYVVGADGVHSLVARKAGLMQDKKTAAAYEVELIASDKTLDYFKGRIMMDYGIVPYGYAWVFPKGQHLSVGIGSYYGDHQALLPLLYKFMSYNNLQFEKDEKVKGSFLSVGGDQHNVIANRIALVGDAAGLVEPFGGEGIYYALWSADLLFERLKEALEGNEKALELYQKDIEQLIIPEFKSIARCAAIFYKKTTITHQILSLFPQVVQVGFDFFKGESSHQSLLNVFKQRISLKNLFKNPTP